MIIEKLNESFLRVSAEPSIIEDIKSFFTFKAPGYKWNPRYRAGIWNGDISMFQSKRVSSGAEGNLPTGLLTLLLKLADSLQEPVEYKATRYGLPTDKKFSITKEEVASFIDSLGVMKDGAKMHATDYQIEGVYEALNECRSCLQLPTGSGKSFVIYCIIRYMIEKELRTILIVPSIMLVKQMLSDFLEYSESSGFDIESACTLLFSGQEKNFENPILISTWQSISKLLGNKKYGPEAINSYDGIIVDEAHGSKGTELQKILNASVDVGFRVGLTGTIDSSAQINELTITGALGPIKKIISTKELMDRGNLSPLTIKAFVMKYTPEECKLLKGNKYQEEIDFLCAHDRRNKFITNIAVSCTGTTLVLFNYVDKHGKKLYELIKEKAKKPVYLVHGGVDADIREEIRKKAQHEDCIIVASLGTMSTGTNIPSIQNVIFASPSKSAIRILQSIGRGLRLFKGKVKMTLIDIVDDLRVKKHENYAFQHFMERLKIYRSEEFEITVKELKL